MTILLTVVLVTYNRAQLLEGALRALAAQEVPDFLKWEVVVVDNNSRDTTAQVVSAFSKTTASPVRYVFEPQQGVSQTILSSFTSAMLTARKMFSVSFVASAVRVDETRTVFATAAS